MLQMLKGGASKGGRRCFHGRAAVLRPLATGASCGSRRCYARWSPVIREVVVGAANEEWWCYQGRAVQLQLSAADATKPMLQSVAANATKRLR